MTPEKTDPHSEAADAVHDLRPVDADLVRSARPGKRILLVLGGGLILVVIGFLAIWGPGGGALSRTNANDGDQAVDTAAFQGDALNPPTADAPTTATGAAQPRPTGEAPNVNAPTVPSNRAPAH
ncbi:MAG TPA: hypothetical protein VF633_01685 [Brevundimonas sp.]|jgi:hypothetical protein